VDRNSPAHISAAGQPDILIYWALGKKGSVSRRNFSIASLIMGTANLMLFLALYFWLVWPMIIIEN